MAAALRAAPVLAALICGQALILDGPVEDDAVDNEQLKITPFTLEGEHLIDSSHKDSKPGSPVIAAGKALEPAVELWRSELSQRVLKAASAGEALGRCHSFQSFGDFTWCRAPMPWEFPDQKYREKFGGMHLYIVNNTYTQDSPEIKTDAVAALSFGVGESDLWSELMSNLYHVKTDLYDCREAKSGPMAKDLHKGHSPDAPCSGRGCYTVEYSTHKICLDDTSNVEGGFTDSQKKQHAPLSQFLKGRAPHSVILKMDVAGAEWGALERLLASDEDLAKIRSMDVKLHFNLEPQAKQANQSSDVMMISNKGQTQASLTRNVEILEKLAAKFAVTGSTLENRRSPVAANNDKLPKAKSLGQVVMTDGSNFDQFGISFVSREVLPPWEKL